MGDTKKYKLDIFLVLNQLNKKNYEFYSNLEEEERKGFIPLVTTRWQSGTSDPAQIVMLSEFVNPFIFTLNKHPDLLYKLMTICTVKPQKYKWMKVKSTSHKHKHSIKVICNHYGYSTQQANEVYSLLSNDTILQFAEQQGLQKDEIQKVKSELKCRTV
jgi:hypothetical protein